MRVLIATCALLAATSLAFAADSTAAPQASTNQALPPAPEPVLPYSWAGFYVRSATNLDLGNQDSTANSPDPFSAPSAGPTSPINGLTGGEIGANWQNGHTVVGFTSDMQWSNQWAAPLSGCGLGCSLNDRVKVPWFATLRARAGEAFDRLYLYGTGGFSTSGTADTLNPAGSSAIPNFVDLSGGSLKWTIGGGMEYAVDNDVTAKLEFLYKSPLIGAPETLFDAATSGSIKNDVVRGGLSYRIPIGQ